MLLKHRHTVVAGFLAMSLLSVACGSNDTADPNGDSATTTSVADTASPDTTESETDTTAPSITEASTTTTEAPAATFDGELVGVFELTAADCGTAGSESGSYFRMAQIGGTLEEGPFIPNADSPCADLTYTPLAPGTDGGLVTDSYQPAPDPAFDDRGSGLADRIAAPVTFFGVDFAMATTDESSAPTITATDGALSGNVSAAAAYYAGLIFNQGAPKPDGSTPGLTFPAPTGTIDPETGAYVLDWASQIVGGPFNDFTGIWHLEGTFVPG